MNDPDDVARQEAFLTGVMDPLVRVLLDAEDPWVAYEAAASMRGVMLDYLEWGPSGGAVFVAWAELEDLFETGKTPIPDAHEALRRAAEEWLARPAETSAVYVEWWVQRVNEVVRAIAARDGNWWHEPS